MWRIAKRVGASAFFKGTAIVFIATNIANLLNFLFNLSMGRLLGPDKYGELGALVSLFTILGVVQVVINLYTVKTVSTFAGQSMRGHIAAFQRIFTPWMFAVGFGIFTLIVIFNRYFSDFLKLSDPKAFILLAFSSVLSLPVTLNRGVMQGLMSFVWLGAAIITEMAVKIVLAVFLVLSGLSVFGAVAGSVLGALISYIMTFIYLNKRFAKVKKDTFKLSLRQLFPLLPAFVTTITLTFLFSVDVVLVRHFFTPETAGRYMAISTLGKITLYLQGPLVTVMFPLITSRASSGAPYLRFLSVAILFSLLISAFSMTVFAVFSKPMINLLFGQGYEAAAAHLTHYALFMGIYALCLILTHFLLSVSAFRPLVLLLFIAVLQPFFIFFIHGSISEVIWVNISVILFYFTSACIFVFVSQRIRLLKAIKTLQTYPLYA